MCGIIGFWHFAQTHRSEELTAIAHSMATSLAYRGPDDSGTWINEESGIAIAHRRLSIVDLSPLGHQPMHSVGGRYVIVFNGEIYNFVELRQDLTELGHSFRGGSDTEVILASVLQWGIEAAVQRFRGMFAFALWDRAMNELYLVRDRVGEKPLYYGWIDQAFVFASELKALQRHPNWKGNIDRDALALFMRYNCIPAPYSIYRGIYKLLPGTILKLETASQYSEPIPYWSAKSVVEFGMTNPIECSDADAIVKLDDLLRDAVRSQMVADVPLGAFLSGGVDSSTIVALMQAQSNRPIKTFSIGFHEIDYNEASYAEAVAEHLGTDHTQHYVTVNEAIAVIPKLPQLYDEPFADSSQIPTFLVSQLAKQKVTVSLSGDAGDELFGGYNRYVWGEKIRRKIAPLPKEIRQILAQVLTSQSPTTWNRHFEILGAILPSAYKVSLPGEKIHKLAQTLAMPDADSFYKSLVSHWKDPTALVLNSIEPIEPPISLGNTQLWSNRISFAEHMMYLDLVTYLPNDILTKVDRASMGVSLESRVPFLDHRVIEFAWQLPLSLKIRQENNKWILRQVLYQYVPRQLIERPKMGFSVPIDQWLRSQLRDWAEDLLDKNCLDQGGFLNSSLIRQKWAEHLSGQHNWQYLLWNVLMFQSWLMQR